MTDRTTQTEQTGPLSRARLRERGHAREDPRPFFDPRRGWIRRFERRVSNALARRVFPRVPGLSVFYDRQLQRGLVLSETEVELAQLAPAFDRLRILFVSDIHAGSFVSPKIRAPMGVFAVLGNHDHYTRDPDRLRDMIENVGIQVLHNHSVALRRGDASLSLVGVDDLIAGQPNLESALAGTHAPVLLLAHNPDLAFDAARGGVALMLSGHTHGGQIRVPGLPVLVRQSRYRLDEGRYRVGPMELLVSRGLGATGLPVRFACPPEAVLIHLSSHLPR